MDVTYTHCAGLDVHKRSVVVCCLTPSKGGKLQSETRTFSTMTHDLLALSDWLTQQGVTHIAMESTAEFWKPIYNLLEANFMVLVVNAQHIKQVPGRKTDVTDAEWIADLLRHGLLRGSFIPPLPQRDLRDLTRQRTNLVQARATVVNQLQKVLEWANLKLTSVVTDVTGVSARAMLQAIVDGETDSTILAELAKGRLRTKRDALAQALQGRVRNHHRFLIAQHLIHLDFLDEQITCFDTQIAAQIQAQLPSAEPPSSALAEEISYPEAASLSASPPVESPPPLAWEDAIALLDTIPGVGRTSAELLVAELGTDMRRFRSAAHLASWAKVCPGNHESAGKRYTSKTGLGNRWLRSALVQAAHAAVKVKDSHFAAVYRRLVVRRGVKKAIIAVAHRIVIAAYYMLLRHEPYREPEPPTMDERYKRRLLNRMRQRIEQLGYTAVIESFTASLT